MADKKEAKRGKQFHHQMKPYLIYDYILKHSDENTAVTKQQIINHLSDYGIAAERRSIYRDIDEINKALWINENDSNYDELEDAIEDGYYEEFIQYNESLKGYYIPQRKYSVDDIRLICECIYSSKYISQAAAEDLVEIMKDFLSNEQAEQIKADALVTDRVRILDRRVMYNLSELNIAMSKKQDLKKHEPEKVTFKYLKYNIDNLESQVPRRSGNLYKVSPYQIIITDGNYYLLAFDNQSKKMRTYRIDRMKDVKRTGEKREGFDEFSKIDLKTYTQRTFGMYSGRRERVTLQFVMSLLDTIVDRFGTKAAAYKKIDEHHFTVTTDVEISPQFYGWLRGFGKSASITYPKEEKEKYFEFIQGIINHNKD